MKRILGAIGIAALAAAGAWAQQAQGFNPAYEQQLRSRPMAPADKSFCSGQAASDQTACQVTRNYLIDISKGADKGYPPSADIKFTKNQDEQNKLVDRLPGG